MSDASENGQRPTRAKSPGRVAAMRRVNELGLRGTGGHPVEHGLRSLEERLRRGHELPGGVGVLLREEEAGVLADLGGAEQVSNMERGLARRIGEARIKLALIAARFCTPNGGPRRMTRREQQEWTQLWCRVAETELRLCQALGLRRRELDAGREIIIQRYAESPPASEKTP